MEHCNACSADFQVVIPDAVKDKSSWWFTCPVCAFRFEVENIQRIVWVWDEYNQKYHTKLVHKYTVIDGKQVRRFEYYDYLDK